MDPIELKLRNWCFYNSFLEFVLFPHSILDPAVLEAKNASPMLLPILPAALVIISASKQRTGVSSLLINNKLPFVYATIFENYTTKAISVAVLVGLA